MTAEALWFGAEERPLFGWMHAPDDGQVHGAVVLCPALGLEGVCAHRTFRHLAERLAAMGLAALRFDYDGTGDSAGAQTDPGRVEAWQSSVRAAVELMRGATEAPVVVVGMRVGATIAACEAARHGGLDGLVLWDPCASGRSYLREQRALGLFSLGHQDNDDGSVEVPGIVYGADTVEALSGLSIAASAGAMAGRLLVLTRPDRTANKAMVQRLETEKVEWGEATGQTDLVDVEPFQVKEPTAAMAAVTSWVADVVGSERVAFAVPGRSDTAAVGPEASERIMRLGPAGLFGIMTEPAGPAATGKTVTGKTVVLLNAGVIDHVGPARLWVDFARRWAEGGVRVLRFDLSGLGDSPARAGQREDEMYPPEAFEDLTDVLGAIAPDGAGDVILTGLCAGGYHSVEGGISLGVGGVCLINPILTAAPAEIHADDAGERAPDIDPRRQATTARKRWVRALPAHDFLGSIVDRMPDAAWWFINRVAVGTPPARIIERLVDSGVETYMVCGDMEARVMRRGQGAAFRRLAKTGRFQLVVLPGIDHELFARSSRDRVGPLVTDRILSS